TIAEFEARAAVKFAEGNAKSKTINAEADATVLRTVGEAEGAKILAVGGAEAKVIEQKVSSMEAGNYAVVQVADALAKGGIKIVPDIVAGGSSDGLGGGLVSVLLGNLLHQDYAKRTGVAPEAARPVDVRPETPKLEQAKPADGGPEPGKKPPPTYRPG
ncbi:MAG TPA: hypothetical protein VIE65_00930, partial [Methylobacter sp.]